MIPRILTDWTQERLIELLTKGVYEPESFDLKEFRTTRKTDAEKQDIRKDCCAFANSSGGFLVYGVVDDKRLPAKNRLIGVDKGFDFPREFGSFPQECRPSVGWDFLNPPIDIGKGKVIHVVFIPQSWRGPHCIQAEKPEQGFIFPKRTNKGNDHMVYDEVRTAFLGYYEKRLKLQLLEAELQNIISDAATMIVPQDKWNTNLPTNSFSLSVIESILLDTYSITHKRSDLLKALAGVRNAARSINTSLQMTQGVFHMPLTNITAIVLRQNQELNTRCPLVINDAKNALSILQEILG